MCENIFIAIRIHMHIFTNTQKTLSEIGNFSSKQQNRFAKLFWRNNLPFRTFIVFVLFGVIAAVVFFVLLYRTSKDLIANS